MMRLYSSRLCPWLELPPNPVPRMLEHLPLLRHASSFRRARPQRRYAAAGFQNTSIAI
jgi:hypothetical protein